MANEVGSGRGTERWVWAWSVLLAVGMLGPALGLGAVLSYDMVWVPDLALNPDVLGLSSGLPRAVPSDAVVAALDEVIPGLVLQKVLLLGLLVAAGVGASRLVPGPLAARVAAAGIYEWNAFVVERLFIGHWPVLIGYALLPWLLLLAGRWRREGRMPAALPLLVPAACLSASAGLASAVVVVAAAWGQGRRRMVVLLLAAGNAPWIVAGLTHVATAATDPAGARLFALNDEGSVPAPLAALTLGGIWNAEVIPDSRAGALGWVSLAVLASLAGLGARHWWRTTSARERGTLLGCWGVGWGLATLTWAAPDLVGTLGEVVPGLGVLRDGARLLALCAPLVAVLVGHGVADVVTRLGAHRTAVAPIVLAAGLLPVALLPDAAWGGQRLDPANYPDSWVAARAALQDSAPAGDVLVLPLSAFRAPAWNHDRVVFDPLGRYLGRPYVASDILVVDGTVVEGEDPRVTDAAEALTGSTPKARALNLATLGFGTVVIDTTAPGGTDVVEVAGEVLVDTGDLVVIVLPDRVADQSTSRRDVALVGLAWGAYLMVPVGVFVVNAARRRLR